MFLTTQDEGASLLFPPEDRAHIVAVACQSPATYGLSGQTHWTIESLRRVLVEKKFFKTVSWTTIQRILRKAEIKPHKMKYYLFCKDPELPQKSREICRLYLRPPKDRLLLCFDERTGTQAIERLQESPMGKGKPYRMDFEYRRHGTLDILAAREVKTGIVFAKAYPKHTQWEFLDFLKKLRRQHPRKPLTLVLDNLQVHQTPAVLQWVKKQNGMVEFRFTPKHASWLNQIELWFRQLNQKCLKRLSTVSTWHLWQAVKNWIRTYNKHEAHAYNWKFRGFLTSAA